MTSLEEKLLFKLCYEIGKYNIEEFRYKVCYKRNVWKDEDLFHCYNREFDTFNEFINDYVCDCECITSYSIDKSRQLIVINVTYMDSGLEF